MQLNVKKRYAYRAIAFIWTVIPTIEITFTAVSTDILQGTCVRFAVYRSHAMKKSLGFFSVFISYLLPLALMIFCYARIVHALRSKVISPWSHFYVNYTTVLCSKCQLLCYAMLSVKSLSVTVVLFFVSLHALLLLSVSIFLCATYMPNCSLFTLFAIDTDPF